MSLGVVCDGKVEKAKELLGETEEGVATGGLHKVSKFCGRSSAARRVCDFDAVCFRVVCLA